MKTRRLLHIGADARALGGLLQRMASLGLSVKPTAEGHTIETRCGVVELVSAVGAEAALACLRHDYINAVLLDARCPARGDWDRVTAAAHDVLAALDDTHDVEARYGFHRIVALVSGPHADDVDQFIVALGGRGIQHVRRQRRGKRTAEFEHDALCDSLTLIQARRRGKRALCASGGGITGIYFELAALKCLDDCLPDDSLHRFDMYFGISAGAVVMGALAAGYSPAEFMAAIAGVEGGRIPPLDLSLLKMGHLNLPDMRLRLASARHAAVRQAKTILRGQIRRGVEDAFLEYTALVGPPFRSDEFGDLLKSILDVPGSTNDFRELPRPLYIGASDQDRREHVLFGSEGQDHIPIHKAIQASLSIHPAFASVEIEGRWYEDGAVTRTSGFVEAIARDADLVLTLDPFVPYVSSEAGVAHRRGLLYNLDQELRTISFTRFQSTRNWVLRKHPDVSSYTFLPSNRSRQLLSTNPMDHRPFLQIWRDGYLSTLRRLERLEHRLRGDLANHGELLDLAPARAIAIRLRALETPRFADFFPNGRVAIPTPPLALERRSR